MRGHEAHACAAQALNNTNLRLPYSSAASRGQTFLSVCFLRPSFWQQCARVLHNKLYQKQQLRFVSMRVVYGRELQGLPRHVILSYLLGPYRVEPIDESQRDFFSNLILDHFINIRRRTCVGAGSGTPCADRWGVPYVGEPEWQWHHRVPGTGLYYISQYKHANDPAKRLRNIAVYLAELCKCDLICPWHHANLHTHRNAARRNPRAVRTFSSGTS